jgi:hypothetical protein
MVNKIMPQSSQQAEGLVMRAAQLTISPVNDMCDISETLVRI